jgi:ubiquinone/menaquinone biosynthesis C-methylase UbiE
MPGQESDNADRDPLAGSVWSRPGTVEGFVQSPANETLMQVAAREWRASARVLDIGCGAGRNTVPLARTGWKAIGVDLSLAMLRAAAARVTAEPPARGVQFVLAPMDNLPFAPERFDLIVAHGIWNLARSGREFRLAIREAARVARRGGALFLFTFSRSTLSHSVEPVAGESFVFTEFAGQPQCFLTKEEIVSELDAAGFEGDTALPLRELNQRRKGTIQTGTTPVIYEGLFRRR